MESFCASSQFVLTCMPLYFFLQYVFNIYYEYFLRKMRQGNGLDVGFNSVFTSLPIFIFQEKRRSVSTNGNICYLKSQVLTATKNLQDMQRNRKVLPIHWKRNKQLKLLVRGPKYLT